MDQIAKFGGGIGYGDSYLELLCRHFKVFRPYAMVHDAAGTMRRHTGKGSVYCYMIGRGAISCLLGHVTGILFCLNVKVFPAFIFYSVEF